MRRRVKKNAGILAALCLVCCASCHDDHDSSTAPRPANTLTLDDVYARQITTLVDQELVMYENVTWNESLIGIASMPLLRFQFEGADRYLEPRFQGQELGDIEIESSDLELVMSKNRRDFYYQGQTLKQKKLYYLRGIFYYSDLVLARINDPDFISQSNNIVYWRQNFKFRLTGLSETPPQ